MKIKTILIGLLTALSSCTINQKILYKTKDISSNQDPKLSTLVLDIEEFADKRKDSPDNEILFTNREAMKLEGHLTCINSEKHYHNEPATRQITRMLINHLNKKNSFRKVLMNKKDTADYYISANLTHFYGIQAWSKRAAAASSNFVITGALVAAGAKSKGKIIIELTDLKIFDKNHQIIKDIGTFRREYEGDFPAVNECWCIYLNVNEKLKDFNTELISTIETSIRSVQQ